MKNGCILCGGVGSGKSRTALAYYYEQQDGKVGSDDYIPMQNPKDLYIITTARKRDTCEWQGELAPFLLSTHRFIKLHFPCISRAMLIDHANNSISVL